MKLPQKTTLILLLGITLAGCSDPPEEKVATNVILITLDTTRADALGCYGGPPGISPNLDRLANGGVLFENAYAPVPLTLPSHSSLMSAMRPTRHGVRDNELYRLPEECDTLAEILSESGYATGAFISASVLDHQFGLDQGFDIYDDSFVSVDKQRQSRIQERRAAEVNESARRWIQGLDDGPFFAWLHYYDPHNPYDPPEGYAAPFQEHGPDRANYYGEIAYCDDEIGKLLEALGTLSERTLIVVTADHGESLGEHGELTHSYFVYQATQRVPLIIHHPDLQPARSKDVARFIDIAPTILELVGIERTMGGDGASLFPIEDRTDRIAYMESEAIRTHFGFQPLRAASNGRFKLIDAPFPELYDLENDPHEDQNLIEEQEGIAEDLSRFLRALEQEAPLTANFDASAESKRLIGELGYTSGSVDTPIRRRDWSNEQLIRLIDLGERLRDTINDKEFAKTVQFARAFIDQCPEAYVGHAYLGTGLRGLSRSEEAIEPLEKALSLAPGAAEARWTLALSLADIGEKERSKTELRALLNQDPRNFLARHKLLELLLEERDFRNAEIHLSELRVIGGENTRVHLMYGGALAAERRYRDAIPSFERALELDSSLGEAAWNLSVCHHFSGNVQRAQEFLRKTLELNPRHLMARQKAAQIAIEKRDSKEARKHLELLIEHGASGPMEKWARRVLEGLGEG